MNEGVIPFEILRAFDLEGCGQEFLSGAGGFSGAAFWRLVAGDEKYCLRRWPAEHPSRERLEWIHRVLLHANVNGLSYVASPKRPKPIGLQEPTTFIEHQGKFWEVTRWMPGTAVDHRPRSCPAVGPSRKRSNPFALRQNRRAQLQHCL